MQEHGVLSRFLVAVKDGLDDFFVVGVDLLAAFLRREELRVEVAHHCPHGLEHGGKDAVPGRHGDGLVKRVVGFDEGRLVSDLAA